ncbi:MAG: hypothetical protein AB1700_07510 [Bacillota bacterium]
MPKSNDKADTSEASEASEAGVIPSNVDTLEYPFLLCLFYHRGKWRGVVGQDYRSVYPFNHQVFYLT